jgi:hypothetical protein
VKTVSVNHLIFKKITWNFNWKRSGLIYIYIHEQETGILGIRTEMRHFIRIYYLHVFLSHNMILGCEHASLMYYMDEVNGFHTSLKKIKSFKIHIKYIYYQI